MKRHEPDTKLAWLALGDGLAAPCKSAQDSAIASAEAGSGADLRSEVFSGVHPHSFPEEERESSHASFMCVGA
eukprot:793886-Rhodomonas_salina.2